MDKQTAYLILNDLHEVLNRNNIPHYLSFGTLLGAYRCNDFLEHDLDIDISCDIKYYWQIREIFKTEPGWQFNCIWTKEIALYKYGRKIDILFADVEAENTYSYIYKPNKITGRWHTAQRYVWKTKDIFPLVETSTYNGRFLLPNNVEKVLETHYGKNFRIPDLNYDREKTPPPNLDKDYRQIAVMVLHPHDIKYWGQYDSDWIRLYKIGESPKEDLVLWYSDQFDFTYIYNLQILIDLINEEPSISYTTIGELTNLMTSQITRSNPKGHEYDECMKYGCLSLHKQFYPMYSGLKTDKESLIIGKAK